MTQPLPIGGYKFIHVEGKYGNWLASVSKDSDIGYLIELNNYIHDDKHAINNDFPPQPETMTPQNISPFNASHYIGEVPYDKLTIMLIGTTTT